MVDKNFRIFLSPQNSSVDLTALTKSFVKRLELDTGYKVYWEAANHYNTAHPHAHLIINGIDKNGKDVEFSRDFVKSFMRENARNICTAMVGSRSMREIALEKEAELTANRKIAFDERIKERMNGTLSVDLDGIKDKSSYVKRLDHLRKIGLAEFTGGKYKLHHKWEDILSTIGSYNCFLNARNSLRFTDKSKLRVFSVDMKYEKLRLIQRLLEAEREAYRAEIERTKLDTKTLDVKEQRKAVFDIDKKYGINVFNEVVKKCVVSDEFDKLGKMEELHTNMGIHNSYGIHYFLIFQSINQLNNLYGKDHSFLAHCRNTVFFAPAGRERGILEENLRERVVSEIRQ
jgi:hypothetical protein